MIKGCRPLYPAVSRTAWTRGDDSAKAEARRARSRTAKRKMLDCVLRQAESCRGKGPCPGPLNPSRKCLIVSPPRGSLGCLCPSRGECKFAPDGLYLFERYYGLRQELRSRNPSRLTRCCLHQPKGNRRSFSILTWRTKVVG